MTIKDLLLSLGKKEVVTIRKRYWHDGWAVTFFEGTVKDALKLDAETLEKEYEGPYDIKGVNGRQVKCILCESTPEKLLTLNDMRNEVYSSLSDYLCNV